MKCLGDPLRLMTTGVLVCVLGIVVTNIGLIGVLMGGPRPLVFPGIVLCYIGVIASVAGSLLYDKESERWRHAMMDEIRSRIQRKDGP